LQIVAPKVRINLIRFFLKGLLIVENLYERKNTKGLKKSILANTSARPTFGSGNVFASKIVLQ
jgi:hypothetical protein